MSHPHLLILGQTYEPWGRLGAMGFKDGERWYMFINDHGTVALIPASEAEQ